MSNLTDKSSMETVERIREAYDDPLQGMRQEYIEDTEEEILNARREETGVVNEQILSALRSWSEIEEQVARQDRYELVDFSDRAKVDLMQAQVRAMLLQAAQLKRIADALENIGEGDSLEESVRIWGTGE